MSYCEKCGAYISVGDTACPACGYDPAEAEERAAEERRRQAAQEARRAEAERRTAHEKAAREAELESERRRARSAEAEAQHWKERARAAEHWKQGGAQYAYQEAPRTQSAAQGASQSWTPPWEESAGRYHSDRVYHAPRPVGKPKNKWISFVLCFLLGVTGAHKFYEGKIPLGLAYLFTGGFFGIGWIIDLIKILCIPDETYYV